MNSVLPDFDGPDVVSHILDAALEKKAEEITVFDVRGYSGVADFFILCTGAIPLHSKSIADGIVIRLKERGVSPWHIEGREEGRWILLDYSDIVIHVMIPEIRDYYQLEQLWSDNARRYDMPDSSAAERSSSHMFTPQPGTHQRFLK